MPCGWLVLFVLTSLAAFAAIGVGLRASPSGRAELFIGSALVFFALLIAPVFLLGYTGGLYAPRLALLSLAMSSATFVASAHGLSVRGHAVSVARASLSLARVPIDALVEALRARSVVVLAIVVAGAVIALSAWISYLAPSEGWDGLFYHEPIVGFALQNHGFSTVPLQPNPMVQTINGYPRAAEAIALWFVIFTDRTFIEIGQTLASPCLMLAVFALARRYGDRVAAIGWAAVLLLVPAMWSELHSAYTDIEITFYVIAALHFATRPELRLRDAALASLAMLLLMSSKGTGLTLVPPIAAVAFGRLVLRCGRTRPRATFGFIAASVIAFAGVAALTLVPNALRFHNPIWPVTYDNASLGIHFKGLINYKDMNPEPPLRQLLAVKYGVPKAGVDDLVERDYGYAVPWVVLPVGAFALMVGSLAAVRELVMLRRAGVASNLLVVAALGIIAAKSSNSWMVARFNLQPIVTCMVGIVWLSSRRRWSRFGEGVLAAAIVLSTVPFAWQNGWFWGPDLATLGTLRAATREERASMYFDRANMARDVALCREKELGRGDLVVFTEEQTWLGVLWNFDFSNIVRYVRFDDPARFDAKLDELRPKWVVVGAQSDARKLLERHSNDWELVGVATNVDGTVAFRRRRVR